MKLKPASGLFKVLQSNTNIKDYTHVKCIFKLLSKESLKSLSQQPHCL